MRITIGLCLAFGMSLVLPLAAGAADWPQWRGMQRDGVSNEVPQQLPAKHLLWRRALAGATHAGIAVSGGYVVVPDHGEDKDTIRCFTADKGDVVWTYAYDCKNADMGYGAGPRATPLIVGGKVYTLSAMGDLYCFDLAKGTVHWQRNLATEFMATVPAWGYCSSPLIVDGKLIVNPGAETASLAVLDPATGKTLWQTPGKPAAYGSFIAGSFGGHQQLIGYDAESIGGWEIATGKRLWTLAPENAGDYFVGTPLNVNGKLLIASDTNAARLYDFTPDGLIVPKPVATSPDLAPDMASPVALDGLVYGASGSLYCLDPAAGLKTAWSSGDEAALADFATIIAGNHRLLVVTEKGICLLLSAQGKKCEILGRLELCRQTLSHPALANGALYVRDDKWLYCYAMK